METTLFIAQVLAVYYLTIGVAFLINGKYYQKEFLKMLDNVLFSFYGGIMALLVGLLILHAHNVWTQDWTVAVTIVGWLATIKGVYLIVFPRHVKIFKPLFKSKSMMTWMIPMVLILGGFFGYFGFVVV